METQSDDDHFLINPSTNPQIQNNPKPTKFYLFAISLPLLLLLLLLFRNPNPTHAPLRESHTRALNLLKHQQFTLIKLFNHTTLINNSTNLAFKSDLLHQISLNKQIHQLLDNVNTSDGSSSNRCGKVDQGLLGRRRIEWNPNSDKYLFAICVSGGMSRRLICLEKHMFIAALINRVLVIPSEKVGYDYRRVVDVERINRCVARKVVVTFEEFAERKKEKLYIDRFICYFSLPRACVLDDGDVEKLEALGVSMSKIEAGWVEDVEKPSAKSMKDVVEKFSTDEDVIAIGDVFFSDVEKEWVMQPGGPISHQCKTLVEPSLLILLTAQRFVQTFLGANFVALHFRRHGFFKSCNVKTASCFYPVPQAAECITQIVERANASVIYLSTDAAENESDLLQSLVVFNGKIVPLVKRPARNSAEKWDALLYRHHIEGDAQVEAMLDKTICSLSSVFIGSSGSTFTEDILRLRRDWSSASVCDEYLCQGELPNFVAEDEDAH